LYQYSIDTNKDIINVDLLKEVHVDFLLMQCTQNYENEVFYNKQAIL